jgi:alcohol dehydrogenase class IV
LQAVRIPVWSDETVVNLLTKEAGLDRDTSSAGGALDAVFRALGVPRTLKDVGVGVGRDKLDILAENSLKDPCLAVNPIPLTEKAQVVEILEMVVGE